MRGVHLVLSTVGVVAAASAVAVAASGSGDTISGCVSTAGKSKGDLRVLSGSGKCGRNETAISWNRTGPAGTPGAKGDAGPRGDTGPAGPQGPAAVGSAPGALVLGGREVSVGAVDAYVKFSGVDGESTAAGYAGQSELSSFGFAIETELPAGGIASGTGRPVVGTFRLTKLVDKSSPILAKKQVQSVAFPSVQISFVRPTPAGAKQYMTVKMTNAYVVRWEMGGEKESALLEHVELAARQYDISYRPVDAQGGLGGEIKFGHNQVTTEVS